MLRLSIGDTLLIKQVATPIVSPWGYRIVHLPTTTEVATQAATLTADYTTVSMTTSSAYNNYVGETLLLEILNGASTVIEQDEFLISGIYGQLVKMQKLVGLLGENVKTTAPLSTDFQQGFELHKTVTLYSSSALTTTLYSYDWTQTFVDDFTPDHRFHRSKIVQKQN